MDNETIFQYLVRAIVLFTALPVHECAHAWAAKLCGDNTAEEMGRLNLNPLVHLDLWGSVLMLLTGFGWAKSVPVRTRNFRHVKRDMALTAIAGPLANLLMALAAMVLLKGMLLLNLPLAPATVTALVRILLIMVTLNVGLAVFNLIPVPPLDGSRLLTALLPAKLYFLLMKYERYFMLVLFALLWTGILSGPLSALRFWVLVGMDRLTGFLGLLV